MQTSVRSGAVVYAKNLGLVSKFYSEIADLEVTEREPGHVAMEANGFQLVVVAIPPHIADTIQIESPAVRREETPIKLVFFVGSVDAAAMKVAHLGGQMNPPERSWQYQGA